MQKPPLAEAQTALGKRKKTHPVEGWYLFHFQNFVKKSCFLTQNFTEIGKSVAESWPTIIFKMAAVRHLEF